MTGGFHFTNSSVISTIHQSSGNAMYSEYSYKYSFSSTTNVAESDTLESQGGYVTLTSTLTETTLSSVFYTMTSTTVDMISATESLSHMTESLLTRAATTTDVKTIKVTVSCLSTTASGSISTPESLLGSKSTISYISEPTTSGSVSENYSASNGASFTTERRTTLGTKAEYFTLSNVLSVESSISLSTPYQGQTQTTPVSAPIKSDVFLSSSYAYSETAETPSEYTGGSTNGKSNSIFKYLSAVFCVVLLI